MAEPDAVTRAHIHPGTVSQSFMASCEQALIFDASGPGRMLRGRYIAQYAAGELGYDGARNKVVKEWLDNFDAEWLWWIDSDMGFPFDSLERLMAVAHPTERPIVGGLCFGYKPILEEDGCNGAIGRAFPTIYIANERDGKVGFTPMYVYPPDTLIEVNATGSAFVVIHRSVFETIRAKHGDTWYTRIKHPQAKEPFGEDLSFCLRASSLGFPTHVHTGIKTNHHKDTYLNEQEFQASLMAPAADERVTVVVPTVRPQNAVPFMRTLRASTGLADALAVVNDDECERAWREAGAEVLRVEAARMSWACKCNDALPHVRNPWFLLVGDDVAFHAGWWDHALAMGQRFDAKVIGTNDLGNPRVMAGQFAVHQVVSTAYAREQGASWDGPGTVCHEGYRYWYNDDELVTVAKQRGVWAMCLASLVEHLHPAWSKAEPDRWYDEHQGYAARDKATFERRAKRYRAVAA